MLSVKYVLPKLCILVLFCDLATCLIIPEELPTILSLIYSNIPPIKKGTDSRLGVGFRLGEHADFQVLVELGPQTRTDPIGNAASNSKRRRDVSKSRARRFPSSVGKCQRKLRAREFPLTLEQRSKGLGLPTPRVVEAMFDAAMRGELGSLAQAVAKYQLERKLRRELEKLKKTREKGDVVDTKESDDKKTAANEWLTKWSKEMVSSSETQASSQNLSSEKNSPNSRGDKTVQRIGRPPLLNDVKSTISDLTKLYKLQSNEKNETVEAS